MVSISERAIWVWEHLPIFIGAGMVVGLVYYAWNKNILRTMLCAGGLFLSCVVGKG